MLRVNLGHRFSYFINIEEGLRVIKESVHKTNSKIVSRLIIIFFNQKLIQKILANIFEFGNNYLVYLFVFLRIQSLVLLFVLFY